VKIKPLFRIQRLHIFTDGRDTYIAFDPLDAVEAWKELTGEKSRSEYDEPFELIPDKEIIKIGSDDDWDEFVQRSPVFSKIHKHPDYNPEIAAPAWAWILQNGRGFLCSTEW
jgi:hypothetical protein